MENLHQRILKGLTIFKANLLLFFTLCLLSSILSIYVVPFLVNESLSEQQLNEAITQVGMTYGGAVVFPASEIIASLNSIFQLFIISTSLIVIAYIVKYKIDKRIFKISKWRDWKFFLYSSGISLILVDFFQKITMNNSGNFLLSLILTVLCGVIIVLVSAAILPEELERIKI